jgi:predicted flap endonuclease-1-like 5' DNA nuclease
MFHVVSYYWIYLALALLGGGIAGFVTWKNQARASWLSGWVGWGAALFAIGLLVALFKLAPGVKGFYLELALLFFAAYIIGCWLGGLLRTLFEPVGNRHTEQVAKAAASLGTGVAAGLATASDATAAAVSGTGRSGLASSGAAASGTVSGTEKSRPDGSVSGASTASSVSSVSAESTGGAASDRTPPAGATGSAAGKAGLSGSATSSPGSSGAVWGLAAPMGGKADDLKRIKGIGYANEKRLQDAGIYHFSQIAAWTQDDVDRASAYLSFQGRIEREGWVRQAKLLAVGSSTEFSKRVDAGNVPSSSRNVRGTLQAPGGVRPSGLQSARNGKPDDLKRIRGIGRQNEDRLNGLGIFHFDQIAAWTADNAEWAGDFMAFPGRIEREDWIAQARLLAQGQETEFSKRVERGEVASSLDDDGK